MTTHRLVLLLLHSQPLQLTLRHCQGLDLGYMLVADFCYRLIRRSLIIARFLAIGKGVGLYAGRLIREYTWYLAEFRSLMELTSVA